MRLARGMEEARRTLLQRRPLEQIELPPRLQAEAERIFGRKMSAAEVVERIVADVREDGDDAVIHYNRELDKCMVETLEVTPEEVRAAYGLVEPALLEALSFAAGCIRSFHDAQREHAPTGFQVGGLGQVVRPLKRVGIYVPGAQVVYPSSVLMTAIPAVVAGVDEVVVATPSSPDGSVSPLKLVACDLAGVQRVFRVGGAQAVAALAYGTASIPRVDKICGPGNIFVALAKRQVYGIVGIDALHGPSETIVLADAQSDPDLCAADLLAQAEHDEMATPILITTSEAHARQVVESMEPRFGALERGQIARAAWDRQGGVAIVETIDQGIELANEFAPEHLCLLVEDARSFLPSIRNAGIALLGAHSVEAVADYTAGPSHVMPTLGSARFSSPLGVQDFLKVMAVASLDAIALQRLGPPAVEIARAEGLTAHAQAIQERLDGIRKNHDQAAPI